MTVGKKHAWAYSGQVLAIDPNLGLRLLVAGITDSEGDWLQLPNFPEEFAQVGRTFVVRLPNGAPMSEASFERDELEHMSDAEVLASLRVAAAKNAARVPSPWAED